MDRLADFSDNSHERALALTAEHAADAIVTTNEVLTEYLTFLAAAPEAMRREGLTDVLTNDRHFEQEGFRALFR